MGTRVTLTGTNLSGATGGHHVQRAHRHDSHGHRVPPGTTTGNVTITTSGGTSNGPVFALTDPDLVASTTTTIPAGPDNPITVTGTGNGTLAGNATVNPAFL